MTTGTTEVHLVSREARIQDVHAALREFLVSKGLRPLEDTFTITLSATSSELARASMQGI